MTTKKIVLLFVFLSLIYPDSIFSQKFNAIDSVVLKYPNYRSIDKLAGKIQKDFTSERDKARAIYSWITLNINYDLKTFSNPPKQKSYTFKNEADKIRQLQLINEKTVQNTFISKKAVCQGFSQLYAHLATLAGLKSEVVLGDSKTEFSDIGRKRLISNHAWNTVQIDGKWILVDATWGQGFYDSKRSQIVKEFLPVYFDQDPRFFYAKHFPMEWEHLDNVGNVETFLNGPLIYNAFIKANCEIIAPNSGIIQANDGDKITFKIKNISKFDNLYYLDKNNKIIKIENQKETNGFLEFQIIFNKNLGQYLTFYLYNEGLVTFKIIPRTN